MTPSQYLESLGACKEAVAWAGQFATIDEALIACTDPRCYAWIAGRLSGPAGSVGRSRLRNALVDVAGDESNYGSFSDYAIVADAIAKTLIAEDAGDYAEWAASLSGALDASVLRVLRFHYPDHASMTAWETETIEDTAHKPGRRVAATPIKSPCWKCGDDRVYCWVCGERENGCVCRNGERNIGDCTECSQGTTTGTP